MLSDVASPLVGVPVVGVVVVGPDEPPIVTVVAVPARPDVVVVDDGLVVVVVVRPGRVVGVGSGTKVVEDTRGACVVVVDPERVRPDSR